MENINKMSDEKEITNNTGLASIVNKLSHWKTIISFVMFISVAYASYEINNYRIDKMERDLSELTEKVNIIEKETNVELIFVQLKDIQMVNAQLNIKIEKTNERLDKVLEILLRK